LSDHLEVQVNIRGGKPINIQSKFITKLNWQTLHLRVNCNLSRIEGWSLCGSCYSRNDRGRSFKKNKSYGCQKTTPSVLHPQWTSWSHHRQQPSSIRTTTGDIKSNKKPAVVDNFMIFYFRPSKEQPVI
jgi:hypothetical protein